MGKLVVGTLMTLDGVMQAPGGPDEDRDGGFDQGGWSVGYWDELMGRFANESHTAAVELFFGDGPTRSSPVTGRRSATTTPWPRSSRDAKARRVTVVDARRLTWANSALLEGDVADAARR